VVAFLLELGEVAYSLADVLFEDDAVDQLFVVLWRAEASEDPHHLVDLLVLLAAALVEPLLLLGVEQVPADHELLPAYALGEPTVVDLHQSELHALFGFAVVLVELHLRQQ
jgi:hypothetical protein